MDVAKVFTGNSIPLVQAKIIASGLRMYVRYDMKPNRMWTPKSMMRAATQITGKEFKARNYLGAADALDEWCEARTRN